MSTTYGATGLGQTAASTRRVSSFFKSLGCVRRKEQHKRQRERAELYRLNDWELMDIGTRSGPPSPGADFRYGSRVDGALARTF